MRATHVRIAACAAVLFVSAPALADYDSHPGLKPETRCVDGDGKAFWPGSPDLDPETGATPLGASPIDCQRLIWDLPATTAVGAIRIGAPFAEDIVPRFPRGLIDRVPPMYVSEDGTQGFEKTGPGRVRLCPEGQIPYWKEHLNEDGSRVIISDDEPGSQNLGLRAVDDPKTEEDESLNPQSGPKFELACTRGVRSYLGPWQTGTGPGFDYLIAGQYVRFENTAHLDQDEAAGFLDTFNDGSPKRVEWNTMTEIYNHFSSHHMTCYLPQTNTNSRLNRCGDPSNPYPKDAHQEPGVECDPEASDTCGACWNGYQSVAEPDGPCHSADADPRCGGNAPGNGGFRNGTQVPGRLEVTLPPGRGAATVEKQIWKCNHHVVSQLPPGSYGMNEKANYRLQTGGIVNPTSATIHGTPPGEIFGGAVGEAIFQHVTESYYLADENGEPARDENGEKIVARGSMNNMFNAVPDLATTYYPPFTWNYHTTLWFPPFDLALTTTAIHAHHRMVKGTMDVVPVNPLRPDSPSASCGGSKYETSSHIYETFEWEDAQVCQYWKEPDGPIILRKGQPIQTTCFVNNGVTPEAIKHGLVASTTVEALKAMGAPIPDYPETVAASTWGDPLAQSPVGEELLYGTHPPINYRVVYKCASYALGSSLVQNNPVSYLAGGTPIGGTNVCSPNPAVDADGDYIDGPYPNDHECGGNWCEPSSIIFRCVGEDEMCIGVGAYYPLPRLGNPDTHDEAMESLAAGDVDNVGTPGATTNTDYVGTCQDCPTLVGP